MLTVQAVRHYANSYRICTPTNDFPTNYVNLIALSGFIGGIPGPFTAIGASGYSYARVLITPGSHLVTGSVPFAASVYGWAEYDSYGHPACFFFGDVVPPTVNSPVGSVTASVNDYPNTPGFVPAPDLASSAQTHDNCTPQPPRSTQTPPPNTLFPPGVHTISISAVDDSGNVGNTNIPFTVLDPSPVIITCPSNIVVNCTSSNGAIMNFTVTAQTTYDPNVPVVSTPSSGSFFPGGTTIVTNTATSLAGQSNSCSFSVTVLCDTRIHFVRGTNSLILSWSGIATLENTTNLGGPWVPVINAVSPYTAPLTGPQRYFRVRF
jgi:HYR domain